MKKWLFNPFEYVAGTQSLLLGITAICLISPMAYFTHTHFDGALDVHFGFTAPLWLYFSELIIGWLSVSVILYIAGKIFSSSSIRPVDVFGTLAMARIPYIIIPLIAFIFPVDNAALAIKKYALGKTHDTAIVPYEMAGLIIIAVLTIIISIWVIVLMWKAYSISCNLKGARGGWSFAIGLIVAEILSKLTIPLINHNFLIN